MQLPVGLDFVLSTLLYGAVNSFDVEVPAVTGRYPWRWYLLWAYSFRACLLLHSLLYSKQVHVARVKPTVPLAVLDQIHEAAL